MMINFIPKIWKLFLIWVMLLCSFFGCNNSYNTFDILLVKEPLIVLNARLVARQSPSVYVGKIWGATAVIPKPTYYNNADVELFEEGKSVGKLLLKDTMYVNSSYVIKSNVRYTIKVNVLNIGNVESEPVLIPSDGQIINISYDTKTTVQSIYSVSKPCLVTGSFKKEDNIAGYGINIMGYNQNEQQLTSYLDNLDFGTFGVLVKPPCSFPIELPDVDLLGNIGLFKYGQKAYISKCLEGSEKNFRILADLRGYSRSESKSSNSNRLIVCVTALSDEVVEYGRTIKIIEGFEASLSEPYPTYSNVKGGLGIVMGYNVTYKIITVQ